ncbi:MAG: hypothetical protein HUU49_03770 [Candidatus Buchananbacteria bacterium]|nr:hypothetical protein [Candidatus Buchananbacteria bacterium]
MSKTKSALLNTLGLFFLFYGVYAIDYSVYRDHWSWVFWICYIGLVIMGAAILLRNSMVIISQLYILTIPLLIWLTDFFSRVFTGHHWFGTTDYFFEELLLPARIISLEHFFLLPLGYVAFWALGAKAKGAWVISIIEVAVIYFMVRLFTDAVQNVNCVFESCFPSVPSDALYPIRWFAIILGMILITWFLNFMVLYLTKKINYNKK